MSATVTPAPRNRIFPAGQEDAAAAGRPPTGPTNTHGNPDLQGATPQMTTGTLLFLLAAVLPGPRPDRPGSVQHDH